MGHPNDKRKALSRKRKTVTTAAPIVPEPYFVGYARVSTEDQRLDLQLDALREIGVKEDNLHVEKISAASKKRPALENAIKDLHEGDTFVVWRLDRLARSVREMHKRLDQIHEAGASFKSLTENFDFSTITGKFILVILGAAAELERQITISRTKAGIASLIARGGRIGAERKMDEKVIARARKMLMRGTSVGDTAKALKVSKASIYNYLRVKHRGGKVVVTRKRK